MKVEQITPMQHYSLMDEFISHEGFCNFIFEFFKFYNIEVDTTAIKQLAGVKNDPDTTERKILAELISGEMYLFEFTEEEWSTFQKSKINDKEKN